MLRLRKNPKPQGASADVLAHWRAHGYVVLPGFFSEERVEVINQLIERAWRERRRADNPIVLDVLDGPLRGVQRKLVLRARAVTGSEERGATQAAARHFAGETSATATIAGCAAGRKPNHVAEAALNPLDEGVV